MSEALVMAPKPRERHPYSLNPVLQELRDMARSVDTEQEMVIAEFVAAYDDAVINEAEFRRILVRMVKAFKTNASLLNVVNLLDESGNEAALREIERVQAKRRQQSSLGESK